MPDERTRPTRRPTHPGSPGAGPPSFDRGEDSPPGQYRETPARSSGALPETIARIALRAPKVSEGDPQQELLRAIAATEGRMLAEIADRREAEDKRQIERQEAFEEQMRKEIQKLVVHEVRSIPPPAAPLPPPAPKAKFELSHLQYVAAFIVALTGLIALLLNAQKPSAEVTKRFDAIDAAELKAQAAFEAHVKAETDRHAADYEYELSVRSWVTDVFERASGVKIDDPPGTPKRDPLGFYPSPKIDPHKISSAHPVQPRDPYPVPPPP